MLFMFPGPDLVYHPPAGDSGDEGARVLGEGVEVSAVDSFEEDVAERDGEGELEDLGRREVSKNGHLCSEGRKENER